MASGQPDCVVFDLGGVLIDWDPRYLYRKLFDESAAMEDFLVRVCNRDWVVQHDRGQSFSVGIAELVARHPEQAELIGAFWTRWPETMGGAIEGSVTILKALKDQGVPVYALSNWSAETWPHAHARFDFLQWFDGLVISGFEGVAKPEAEIYRRLRDRYGLAEGQAVFIDDVAVNVEAARAAGLQALQFHEPLALRRDLEALGFQIAH